METPELGDDEVYINRENWSGLAIDDLSDLPVALIVTGVPFCVFDNETDKEDFESLFKRFQDSVGFEYFRSFKRVRVTLASPQTATLARLNCEQLPFKNVVLKCFFAQMHDPTDQELDATHLHPPPLEKQFLISPPASPPVGWEQSHEAEPLINHDLVARLAALSSSGSEGPSTQELHPGSDEHPAILVHTCADINGHEEESFSDRIKPPLPHTPCPPRNTIE